MANHTGDFKNTTHNSDISTSLRSENYLILSTTYPLNNSDTKRLHVGLRAVTGTFEAAIKLTGDSSAGIYFDQDTWGKFQENVEHVGNYLRRTVKHIPDPIVINNIVINFTSAYGARAIMVSKRNKTLEKGVASPSENDSESPAPKKRKTYAPAIVMQKTSFEGLENIINCINVRYKELNSIVNLVNDCSQFLITEIELNLPNRDLDEEIVKQTLFGNYQEIQGCVQRQLKDLDFLNSYFEILFQELTSLYLYEIVRKIIINRTS